MNEDLKHLNWLSTGFYVYAGLTFLFSLFPVIHLSIGIAMITGAFPGTNNAPPPPAFMGWFFVVFAALFILFGMAVAFCNFLAARFLKQQKNYIFCFVIGALDCLFAPLGTVLGVFTILTLLRDPVKELFGKAVQTEFQPMAMTPPDWR
jgi:hypothetical protein